MPRSSRRILQWAFVAAAWGCAGAGRVESLDARAGGHDATTDAAPFDRDGPAADLGRVADGAPRDAGPRLDAGHDGAPQPDARSAVDAEGAGDAADVGLVRCDDQREGGECVTDDLRWGRCAGGDCRAIPVADDPAVCDGDDRDVCADTWVIVDGLGRAVPGAGAVGAPRPDRFVAMFYWIWHEVARGGPYDVSRILAENPGDPAWGPLYAPHHWGEPELGYYTSVDPYVYRKHAALLADAGIDVLIFDTSNTPFTWPEAYLELCGVLDAMRAAGQRAPKIAFLTPFWEPAEVVRRVYRDVYAAGVCQDHWFLWEGKPLIMANPRLSRDPSCDACTGGAGCDAACQGIGRRSGSCAHPGSVDPGRCCECYEDRPSMTDFFTFRTPVPGYFDGPSGINQWGWMEIFPQHVFRSVADPTEQMVVSVAQNATDRALKPMSLQVGIHGRSWHDGARDRSAGAVRQGYNFQEQWDRALEIDPTLVFVTGWNEWVAGRFETWAGVGGGAVFPDEYDQEFSRDIEPMRRGHGDDYYYQLMSNVRRYKGARRVRRPSPPRTVPIGDGFAEWAAVAPVYRDTAGDTAHRDAPGYGGTRYTERSGRNDLLEARVTWDEAAVFFYVRAAAPLTPWDDPSWMVLLIDADHDRATGWRGYEYSVTALSAGETQITRLADGAAVGQGAMAVTGAELELSIPRPLIGQAAARPHLTFHWSDNAWAGGALERGEVPELGVLGDNAPNRRASYDFAPR